MPAPRGLHHYQFGDIRFDMCHKLSGARVVNVLERSIIFGFGDRKIREVFPDKCNKVSKSVGIPI
jgi:hypothetical protein